MGLLCVSFILLCSSMGWAQNNTVSGTVTNAQTGEALNEVNIIVQGTTTGTSTDENGEYKVAVPSKMDTLVFTYIGFKSKIIPIKGRSHIDVKLEPKTFQAEELVVTAFGVEKQVQDVVGAVASLSQEQLETIASVPTNNLTTALSGRIPGLIAYQRTGEPGANNASFFVRGVTTFGYSQAPLILIDNVKATPDQLANLNPDDIASFTILKDATATSLYGSEAANGVLLITTKEGVQGEMRVSLRMDYSISEPTQVPEFADPVTFMKMANKASLSRAPLQPLPYTRSKIINTKLARNPYLYPSVNWREMLFKDYAPSQQVNLHVSGGGQIAQYYVSGAFDKTTGLLEVPTLNNFNNNINLKNYSLRTNVNVNLLENTELEIKISGNFTDYQGPLNSGKAVYHQIVNASPVRFPAKFPVDSAHAFTEHPLFGGYPGISTGVNPYAQMVKGYKHYAKSKINAQFGLHQIFPDIGLKLSGLLNVQRYSYSSDTRSYNPFYYYATPSKKGANSYSLIALNPESGTNYLTYSPGSDVVTSSFFMKAQASYMHMFGKKHELSSLLVFTARNRTYDNAEDLQSSLPQRNVNLAGRLSYNYDQRYYVELNAGLNASERFAESHRWGFFPSVGVAWNVSNEEFWDPIRPVVSRLKLRASFGYSGNDDIGSTRFLYLSKVSLDGGGGYTTGIQSDYSTSTVSISHYPNSSVTWERAQKLNIGIRLGLFNQFTAKLNFFWQHRTNILQVRTSIPASMGLSAIPRANTGATKSHGMDAHIRYTGHINNNWSIVVRGNFTYATSEYVKFNEFYHPNAPNLSHIGLPITQRFGYYAERLFIDEEDVQNSPSQSFGPYGPGDIKYRDINGDGRITSLDKIPLGYPVVPEINYGFGFTAQYKNVDLSLFFQGLARESFWINTSSSSSIDDQGTAPFVGGHQLLKVYAKNHWSRKNRNISALYPHFSSQNSPEGIANNAVRSTWFMRNGAFLRFKALQIGYSLPQSILNRFSVRKFRIYVNVRNLTQFSPFKLWDPEMAGNGLSYPLQRTYNLGIVLEF